MRRLTVSLPGQPGIEIVLMAIEPPIPEADQASFHELLANGSLPAVIFTTDGRDAAHRRLSDAGVPRFSLRR